MNNIKWLVIGKDKRTNANYREVVETLDVRTFVNLLSSSFSMFLNDVKINIIKE